ncbi:hypothetical protein N7495_008508 [Penicillium taxi]|uniref:uncharacterized protein n=1 Tax=Penicillium taxi TaxID=168475 RepID=UPI002544D545|nr:uncharacterized protein N7495_008508 [Penicillium taxi]KAJ5888467.1 hypothetical protein N7495_008508 [Penicillium taxi]
MAESVAVFGRTSANLAATHRNRSMHFPCALRTPQQSNSHPTRLSRKAKFQSSSNSDYSESEEIEYCRYDTDLTEPEDEADLPCDSSDAALLFADNEYTRSTISSNFITLMRRSTRRKTMAKAPPLFSTALNRNGPSQSDSHQGALITQSGSRIWDLATISHPASTIHHGFTVWENYLLYY